VALCQVLRALGCRWWIASVVASLMFTKPAVMAFEYYVAQESLVLPLLYGTLWALARYVRAPSLGRLAVVLGLATALVLTRALFSPLWLLGLVAVVLALRPPPVGWRRLAAVAVLPFLLVGGFMAKNQLRFGTFELSSWMGMNLSRVAVLPLGTDRTRELIDEGVLSEAAIVGPFRSYDAYEPYLGPCESDHHGTPVLDDPSKDDGTWFENPNFNATCYIPVYDQAWSDALAAIRHEPRTYARAVGANVVVYLSDGGDGSSRAGWVGGRFASVLTQLHDLLGLEVTRSATYPNVWTYRYDVVLTFVLGLAVVTVAAVRAVRRRIRGTATGRDALVLAVAWTALSVSAVSVLADAFENARFRAPLDPLVIGIVVAGAAEALARAVAARRSPAISPSAG
jgi:hypothetical protein